MLVNGKEAARSSNPSSYVEVSRGWRNGDEIELQLTMEIATDSAPAAPDSDLIVNEREIGKYNDSPFTPPMLRGDPGTIAWTIRRAEKSNEFVLVSAEHKTVRLIPSNCARTVCDVLADRTACRLRPSCEGRMRSSPGRRGQRGATV